MIGEGIAIESADDLVVSPINGTAIIEVTKHAIGLATEDGFEIRIHLRLDTVEIQGAGFQLLTTLHTSVKVSNPLISFSQLGLLEKRLNIITVVVITNPNNKNSLAFYL